MNLVLGIPVILVSICLARKQKLIGQICLVPFALFVKGIVKVRN